jgi:hypothetical protein
VELEEGAVASDLPKVATTMATGDGRSGQAAAVIQIARGTTRERERGANGAGLGRFDRPRPELVGLAEPGGPAGPAGQLGQQASWASRPVGQFCQKGFLQINLNQNLKFNCYPLS